MATEVDRKPYTVLMQPTFRERIAHVVGHTPLLTVAELVEKALDPVLKRYERKLNDGLRRKKITRVRRGRPVTNFKAQKEK